MGSETQTQRRAWTLSLLRAARKTLSTARRMSNHDGGATSSPEWQLMKKAEGAAMAAVEALEQPLQNEASDENETHQPEDDEKDDEEDS